MNDSARTSYLENQFLIAMPRMLDPYFTNTVTYLWKHNEEGALGIVINKPLKACVADIFAELDVQELSGGPRDPAGYSVSGQVFNEGELIASEIKVVVTLYGVDGNVRAFRQVYLTDPLPPRAGSTFRVEFLERPEEVRRYTAVAQGRLAKSN